MINEKGLTWYPGKYPGIKIFTVDDKYMYPGVQAFTNCRDKIFIRKRPCLFSKNNRRVNRARDPFSPERRFEILQNLVDAYDLTGAETDKLARDFILQHEHEHIADPFEDDELEIDRRALRKIRIAEQK